MRRLHRNLLLLPILLTLALGTARSQSFSVDEYERFLEENRGMTSGQIEEMYGAGTFTTDVGAKFAASVWADSINRVYDLTDYEKSLIARHGFMVSERLTFPSFGDALHDIYINDLPVFISTDAILHAVHKSYDAILMDVEETMLIPRLQEVLTGIHAQIPSFASRYSGDAEVMTAVNDLDAYITVAIRLLNGGTQFQPHNPQNRQTVEEILGFVESESPANIPLFSETPRFLDFSQFTIRGHYTQSESLGRYFQAMIWLGRTELYLSEIKGVTGGPTPADVKRQTLVAALIQEALATGGLNAKRMEIEKALAFMVGESDNVSPDNLDELFTELGIGGAGDLTGNIQLVAFQKALASKPYAGQRILSQILMGDPMSPEKITPPSAYLIFGQRFVIDSYVLGNVVHDKVDRRMLPSSLDMLFAIGNDAALQFLRPEIDQYGYADKLAGLRYLIDSYGPEFWDATLYAGWLGAIRELSPPRDREGLPAFMQTAAWWQQKMNTQLASWAQLRHDNLLYAKQSYTGGIGCSYPEGYVEPFPEFYAALGRYAQKGKEMFGEMGIERSAAHFAHLAEVSAVLEEISRKELAHQELTEEEKEFFSTTLSKSVVGCGEIIYNGWYPQLFMTSSDVAESDFIVADVHTSPTDAAGNMVGWVMHVGTGNVNLAVVTCKDPEGNTTAYVGPVMSYHEHVTANFDRLTDERWATGMIGGTYSDRPAFTNLYLADATGGPRGEVITLETGTSSVDLIPAAPVATLKTSVFPNPTQDEATIVVEVPHSLAGEPARVAVYTLRGELVTELLNHPLPSGTFFVNWNTKGVSDGAYVYQIDIGDRRVSGQVTVQN